MDREAPAATPAAWGASTATATLLWTACLLAAPFAVTWTRSRFGFSSGRRSGSGNGNGNGKEPPMAPYVIPWLGHGLAFVKDINGYAAWVRSLFPHSPITTSLIAGRKLYFIFDAKLASQVYRHSKTFIFDPFVILTITMVGGTSKEDLRIMEMGAQVLNRKEGYVDDGRRVLHGVHVLSAKYFQGEGLEELTNRFIETVCAVLDRDFAAREGEGGVERGREWRELDLFKYTKKTWTYASIVALFGTHIYEIWPRVGEWLWEFDEVLQTLLMDLPEVLNRRACKLRSEGLEMFQKWEEDAEAAEERGEINGEELWNKYWGHRYCKERSRIGKMDGLEARTRAAMMLGVIWGQNANVIPVAMQVMNQAFRNPVLLRDLQSEISKCQTGPTSFNIVKLTSQSKLKSVFLEALRWATASPSPRIVKEDCELGGYKLKAGSMLIVHARTLQMEDDIWRIPGVPESDPENFWPERFLDGDEALEAERANENREAEINYVADTAKDNNTSEAEKRKFQEPLSGPRSKDIQQRMQALRPFGGGTSMCPGRFFSSNEVIGGLAALLLRLEVEVIDEELRKNGVPMPDLMKQGGLFPDRPMIVRMRRRVI